MKRSTTTRKLALEQCESRQMLAGNVTTAVTNGNLAISGDNAGNGVQIAQARIAGVAISGWYVVSGFDQSNAPTTINGQTGQVLVTGVTNDVTALLGDGNDRFRTGPGTARHFFANDLRVFMGGGNNNVSLNNISVRDDLVITSSSGVDNIFVRGIVGNSAANPDADLSMFTGDGGDHVTLLNLFVRDSALIDTGAGNFSDVVDLISSTVGEDVSLLTGGGADSVRILQVRINDDLHIETGAGNDSLVIQNSEVDEMFALIGADNDRLEMSNTFGRRATLNGGDGIDTLATSDVDFPEFFATVRF